MEQFVCSHCGHHFSTAPQETIICPSCFWSTSVKPEISGNSSAPPVTAIVDEKPERAKVWVWAGGAFFVVLLLGASFFGLRHLQKQDAIIRTIESENAKVIATEAPELALLPPEREILNQAVSLETEAPLTESEKEILARRVPLRSRLVQGLATPPWNEKEFETFLKTQESQYRLPFGWSYRRKLVQLFGQHYLPAAAAFEAKDFLKARDGWIRTLAFPLYQGNIQKHRGVVLTMLRPYINDTLARIGAINAMLTEKDSLGAEEKIRSSYEAFFNFLQAQSWEEANAKLLEIEKDLESVGKFQGGVAPPPLPPEISLIDADVREVLLAQIAPAQPGVRDWETLKQDLDAKEKVIFSHLPSSLEAVRQQYNEALTLIKNGNWRRARDLLQKIDFPESLAQDARAKVEIINKSLEKESKTG